MDLQKQTLPESKIAEIKDALRKRGALDTPCARCGKTAHSVGIAYSVFRITDRLEDIGRPLPIEFLPAVFVICDHCGCLTQHALYALGVSQ